MNEKVDLDTVADARPAPLPVHSPTPSPVTAPAAPPPAPRRNRLARLVVVLAFALALIAGGLYYEKIGTSTLDASRPAEPKGPPPQTVRAAEAVSGDMPITIDALGTVTPLATVTIKTQIAGKLMQVGFTEGQLVKEGDFLAQIDPRPFEAVLAQAQGQLAKDTSLYEQAQADLARYITLSKQDSIAHQQVDDQTFLVAQDKAAMATDQATIDAAKLNIYYTHIVSPITGRVGLRLVDAGNYVQPTDRDGPRRHYPARPDQRRVLDPGRQSAADHASPQFGRHPAGNRPRSLQRQQTGDGDADDVRQSDRHDDRHVQVARDFRQS